MRKSGLPACWGIVSRNGHKIEEDLRLAEEKLKNIRLENENTLKLAKSKTTVYGEPEQK